MNQIPQDGLALLRAVNATPHDDAIRLVAADWFAEQLASGDGIAVVPTLELWEGLTRRIYPLTGPADYEAQARAAIEDFTSGE